MTSIEVKQLINQHKKNMVGALLEGKVSDDEIIRLLMKYCNVYEDEALELLKIEKLIDSPCRKLYQYLIVNVYLDENEAQKFIKKNAQRAILRNPELAKVSPAKFYEAAKKITVK